VERAAAHILIVSACDCFIRFFVPVRRIRRRAMRTSLVSLVTIAALGLLAADAEAANQVKGELATAQAKLAWVLIDKLASRTETVTVSPASLASAFGIIGLGADPPMKTAIARALGFGPQRAEDSLAALVAIRGKLANASETFQSANRIVSAPTNPSNEILRARLENLGIDYSVADLSNPEAAAKIDAWVKEVTQGAIPEILGGPVKEASFVALNALHFKGRWKTQFDRHLTATASFKGVNGNSGNVAMMHLGQALRAFRQERIQDRDFVAIDLPFADERYSLVVVTTTDRPALAGQFAPVANWLSGSGFSLRFGDLALPWFSVSAREDLMPVLDTLGLDKARHAASALHGFAPGTMLSQVVQRTMVEVDEEGAEAAAASSVIVSRSLEADDAIHMVVDKPFIYALRDYATGLILAAGYVGHPPKGKTV
jgi:serine protease inhibitor